MTGAEAMAKNHGDMIASDEKLMRKTIRAFRDAGYEIWMDDFGSGYSSLTMLKDYDFNTLNR